MSLALMRLWSTLFSVCVCKCVCFDKTAGTEESSDYPSSAAQPVIYRARDSQSFSDALLFFTLLLIFLPFTRFTFTCKHLSFKDLFWMFSAAFLNESWNLAVFIQTFLHLPERKKNLKTQSGKVLQLYRFTPCLSTLSVFPSRLLSIAFFKPHWESI